MITTEDGDVAIGHPSILLPYPRLFCALLFLASTVIPARVLDLDGAEERAERGGIAVLHLPLFLALRTAAFLIEIGRDLMSDDGLLQLVENLFALLQCQAHRFDLRLGTHQVGDLLKVFRSIHRDGDYLDAEVHVVSFIRSAAFTSRRLNEMGAFSTRLFIRSMASTKSLSS